MVLCVSLRSSSGGKRIPAARAVGYLPQLLRSQSFRPPTYSPIIGRAWSSRTNRSDCAWPSLTTAACRRVATQNFRRFLFLGFASEAFACRRFATAGPGPSCYYAESFTFFQLAPSCEATTGISLGRESEVTVPCKSNCEATTGDTVPDDVRLQLEQAFQSSVVAGTASEQTDRATTLRKSRRKVCNLVNVPSPPARGRRWPAGRMRGFSLSLSCENCNRPWRAVSELRAAVRISSI